MKIEKRVNSIIQYARQWIDTPYVHQGRLLGTGCDCAGFLVGIGEKFDYEPEDLQNYSPIPQQKQLEELIDKQLVRIGLDQIAPADIVLMNFYKSTNPHHIGLITDYYGGGLGMIHCYQNIGKVVEHVLSDKWKQRIQIAYRFPDIYEMKKMKENINKTFDSMTSK
jgi:NlpC/P60 family putative phage cell wall peptidase